jgi:hypothetical protein
MILQQEIGFLFYPEHIYLNFSTLNPARQAAALQVAPDL